MFDQSVFNHILKNEGVYSNDSNDRGGETVYGIARVLNPQWVGWKKVDSISGGIRRKRRQIPRYNSILELAREFYEDLWNSYGLNGVQNTQSALYMYDALVNIGPFAKKLIQRSLGVTEDGMIGPITRRHINEKSFTEFVIDFARVRMVYYITIQDPRYSRNGRRNKKFIRGWLLRAMKIPVSLPDDLKRIYGLMSKRFKNNSDRERKVIYSKRILAKSMRYS